MSAPLSPSGLPQGVYVGRARYALDWLPHYIHLVCMSESVSGKRRAGQGRGRSKVLFRRWQA